MNKIDFDDILKQLDNLVRQGQHGLARELLTGLNLSQLPRKYSVQFADFARRVNTPKLLVSLLRAIIHNEIPTAPPATTQEKALYATGLSRLGSFSEANILLKNLNIEEAPEALLFLAQNFMIQWDDVSAIPKLKKYISQQQVALYSRLVGKINLAACYISEQNWFEGEKNITAVRNEIESIVSDKKNVEDLNNFRLLFANSLELSAQAAVLQKDYEKALNFIARSEKFLSSTKSRYELLLKKWKAIINLLQSPKDKKSLEQFLHLKSESKKARNWETFRDLEFYEALALKNDDLFLKIYHGTPHASFRKRIKQLYDPKFKIPKIFIWNVNTGLSQETKFRIFDLAKGAEKGRKESLMVAPLLFKLFQLLTKDFYRPVSIGALIAHLYEGEYYNPVSSPEKAMQAIKRLRKWFEDNEIPLDIEANDTSFRLVATTDYGIQLSYLQIAITKHSLNFERMQTHFSGQFFSAKTVSEELNIPLSAARKLLGWASAQKQIVKIASGRSTKFKFRN